MPFDNINNKQTRHVFRHIGWSALYKAGSIVANFLLIPLSINFLSVEDYGVWLTLSSFVGWFSLFDIGLGNGLRNKFAEAKAVGDDFRAQSLVSTAYFALSSISFVLFLIFMLLNQFVNWALVFNVSIRNGKNLAILMPTVFAFFVVQLVVKLITSIHQANQSHSVQEKIQFIIQAISLFFIYSLSFLDESSLLIFGIVYSASPVIVLILFNIYSFRNEMKIYKPKLQLCTKENLVDIFSLGVKFFILQTSGMILFTTDNLLIAHFFGPEEVVPYNIAFKYFSIVTMLFMMITTPYWSSFTIAYAKQEIKWIQNSVRLIQKIWIFVPFLLLFMILVSDRVYILWVGARVSVPFKLTVAMACFVLISTSNMIYSSFINGIGKIKLNLIFSVISMVINIPLSYFFGKVMGWGSMGVIASTCFCLLYAFPFLPIQYNKLINNRARGIWNK